MLPMQVNRKVVENYVMSLIDSVAIVDKYAYWNERDYKRFKKLLHHTKPIWADIQQAFLYLVDIPLFSRMLRQGTSPGFFRELIPKLAIVEKKVGNVIFNEKGFVYIVINGRVALRYHMEDPLEYQMIAQYTPGHVIGHPSIDNGVSLMGQVYPIVVSTQCVLLKVK